jgi:RimJ/RimL family protein N-acetyltransferase
MELMRALAREAVEKDCRRFVWQVLDWNEPAIAFYERLGAKVLREWLTVRVEGEALATLAGSRDPC